MRDLILAAVVLLSACSDRPGQHMADAGNGVQDAGSLPQADAGTDAGTDLPRPRNVAILCDSARIDVMEDGYWIELGKATAQSDGIEVPMSEALPGVVLKEGTITSESPPSRADIWVDMARSSPEVGTVAIRFEFRSGVLPGDMAGVRISFP